MNFQIFLITVCVQKSNTCDRSSVEQGFEKFVTHLVFEMDIFFLNKRSII